MLKSKEFSEFECGEIIGLYKINLSVRNIAVVLLFKKSTVQDIINKYKNCGLVMAASRRGRPYFLTKRNTRTLVKIVKKNRQILLDKLTENFNKFLQISACSKTIKYKLYEKDYYSHIGKKKPLVSKINRKKRLF